MGWALVRRGCRNALEVTLVVHLDVKNPSQGALQMHTVFIRCFGLFLLPIKIPTIGLKLLYKVKRQ